MGPFISAHRGNCGVSGLPAAERYDRAIQLGTDDPVILAADFGRGLKTYFCPSLCVLQWRIGAVHRENNLPRGALDGQVAGDRELPGTGARDLGRLKGDEREFRNSGMRLVRYLLFL